MCTSVCTNKYYNNTIIILIILIVKTMFAALSRMHVLYLCILMSWASAAFFHG